MDTHKLLDILHFEQKEKTIYLYLVTNPQKTQQEISDGTGIIRQTVYDTIKQMERSGKVQIVTTGKRKMYEATNPRMLLSALEDSVETFRTFLPLLQQKVSPSQSIQVKTFVGYTSLRNLIFSTLENTAKTDWIQSRKMSVFESYVLENYAKKRRELNIPIRVITDKLGKGVWKSNAKELRKVKSHNIVKNQKAALGLTDNKAILYTLTKENLIGIYIESSEISQFLQTIFELLWSEAKA